MTHPVIAVLVTDELACDVSGETRVIPDARFERHPTTKHCTKMLNGTLAVQNNNAVVGPAQPVS